MLSRADASVASDTLDNVTEINTKRKTPISYGKTKRRCLCCLFLVFLVLVLLLPVLLLRVLGVLAGVLRVLLSPSRLLLLLRSGVRPARSLRLLARLLLRGCRLRCCRALLFLLLFLVLLRLSCLAACRSWWFGRRLLLAGFCRLRLLRCVLALVRRCSLRSSLVGFVVFLPLGRLPPSPSSCRGEAAF